MSAANNKICADVLMILHSSPLPPIRSSNPAFFELYCSRHRFLTTNLIQAYLLNKRYIEIPWKNIKGPLFSLPPSGMVWIYRTIEPYYQS